MSYGEPLVDVIAEVQSVLKCVAPSFDDERSIAKHDVPTRYVWVLEDSSGSLDVRSIGRRAKGLSQEIQTDVWRVLVHCWGYSATAPTDIRAHKSESLKLRRALITALNDCLPADGFEETGTRHRGGLGFNERGWVCIVELNLMLPLYAFEFAEPATRLVRPTEVGFANVPPSIDGDNELVIGED